MEYNEEVFVGWFVYFTIKTHGSVVRPRKLASVPRSHHEYIYRKNKTQLLCMHSSFLNPYQNHAIFALWLHTI